METRLSRAVLITGCSTGIGRATAERLLRSRWKVAAVEGAESLKRLLPDRAFDAVFRSQFRSPERPAR